MEKRLLIHLINDLNAYGTSLYLSISLETTNISKTLFLYALIDFGAIRVFINRIFVEKYYLNIYKLKFVLVYNVDDTSNIHQK